MEEKETYLLTNEKSCKKNFMRKKWLKKNRIKNKLEKNMLVREKSVGKI